jgi:hypothetical protein
VTRSCCRTCGWSPGEPLTTEPRDLQAFIRHVDQFGPDGAVETAAQEGLPGREVAELQAYVNYREATMAWYIAPPGKSGGEWRDRRGRKVRPSELCGLDLPRGARANQRFHSHCRSKAARERAAER